MQMRLAAAPLLVAAVAAALSTACEQTQDPVQPAHPSFGHGTTDLDVPTRRDLAALRAAIAPFNRFDAGEAAGWDTPLTVCWFHSELGAMGYHYGKPAIIDDAVSLTEPELLVYAPQKNGRLRLVAVEYIVPTGAWQGSEPPSLLGQEFHMTGDGALYILHVWTGLHNPAGIFADWNPNASCEYAEESEDRA